MTRPSLLGKTPDKRKQAFLLGLCLSFLFFLPYLIHDQGYFFFYGDFNAQQVPFYQLAHDAVREGSMGWNWNTDLGANFIGSYSFYLLGSPFFWLTIPFPGSWVPYLMAPLLMLKYATASLTAYCYLRRQLRNQNFALMGALLYAFSGFSTYNLFFNHFHDVIAFFPLLLLGLDLAMEENRKGVLALALALNCAVNYFFFVGEAVFLLLYWIVRLRWGDWKVTWKKFGCLALEAVLGVLLSSALLLPSLLALAGNPRSGDIYYGWSAVVYSKPQLYAHILQSLFFLPELPARPVFFPGADVKWSSLSGWLPLFGMTGVLSYFLSRKGGWKKILLGICGLFAMVPLLNSAFVLFRGNYYARWFYMPLLIMSLVTARSLESPDTDWKRGLWWSSGITAFFIAAVGLIPSKYSQEGGFSLFGLYSREYEEYPARFWLYATLSAVCLLLVWQLLRKGVRTKEKTAERGLALLAAVIVLTNVYYIGIGKSYSDDVTTMLIPHAVEGRENLHLPDPDFYRIDVLNGLDNLAMYWKQPSINAFHSVVPASVMSFYRSIEVERNVASRPPQQHYPIRSLLSVEYVFENPTKDGFTMPGYQNIGVQNGFKVWKNTNHIPMGFAYSSYLSRSDYDALAGSERKEQALLRALVVPDEMAEALMPYFDGEFDGDITLDYSAFQQACSQLRDNSCKEFEVEKDGFRARFDGDAPRLVFFSVPNDAGWSAAVDGEEVEIVPAQVGFMAVPVPAGEHEIVFRYTTPGLRLGGLLSLGAAGLLIGYLLLGAFLPQRERKAGHLGKETNHG